MCCVSSGAGRPVNLEFNELLSKTGGWRMPQHGVLAFEHVQLREAVATLGKQVRTTPPLYTHA